MLDHKHLIVNAEIRQPFVAGDEKTTCDWLSRVVQAVGMKAVIGPHAHYCTADGNNGITASVNIETSHAALHVWDKTNPKLFRFDLYSCSFFNPLVVIQMIEEFDPVVLEWVVIDRNQSIKSISNGKIHYGS